MKAAVKEVGAILNEEHQHLHTAAHSPNEPKQQAVEGTPYFLNTIFSTKIYKARTVPRIGQLR